MSDAQVGKPAAAAQIPGTALARSVKRGMGVGLNIVRRVILRSRQDFPDEIRSVLVVCKGNICRSPLAEAYLKSVFGKYGLPVKVESAGLETSLGKPAHSLAQLVGEQHGLSLSSHATKPLHREQVDRASLILVMEWRQRRRLVRLYPEAVSKVYLLRQFYDQSVEAVADPYSGTIEDFRRCMAMLKIACDTLVDRIRVQGAAGPG